MTARPDVLASPPPAADDSRLPAKHHRHAEEPQGLGKRIGPVGSAVDVAALEKLTARVRSSRLSTNISTSWLPTAATTTGPSDKSSNFNDLSTIGPQDPGSDRWLVLEVRPLVLEVRPGQEQRRQAARLGHRHQAARDVLPQGHAAAGRAAVQPGVRRPRSRARAGSQGDRPQRDRPRTARRSARNVATSASSSGGSGCPISQPSSRSASAGLRASTGPCR